MGPKVFCIGFHKTATTSLGAALTQLGFRTCGLRKGLLPAIKQENWAAMDRIVDKFDAFQDNPWPLLYQTLDARYPGSKFILTVRDRWAWLRSVMNHFGDRHSMMREWIYGHGAPEGVAPTYLERFMRHNIEVQSYFARRPQDLLVMDIPGGDGWELLAPFLGVATPHHPFPQKNVRLPTGGVPPQAEATR